MSETTKQLFLVLTMTLVALAVGGVAVVLLHGAAVEQARQNLAHTAKAQARLMEAVARFDVQHSAHDHPQGATGATLSQIIDSLQHYEGFGATGAIVIGRRDGDRIVVLHHQRRDESVPQSLPWDGPAGDPMRRALRGEAGTALGQDARGREVLAAYEPVAGLGIGVVAKIDLEEINAPFVHAGLYAGAVALLIIVLGATLFLRVTNPLVRRLAESEERFRTLARAALEGIMFTDNGRIIEINETGAALAGSTRAALIGRNVLDFCAPADRERVATQMRDNVNTPYEFIALRADGSEFPVEVRGRTSTYHGHAVRVTVFRDLTERRRVVQALRDSEQLLRLVLDTLPVGVWVADKQGKIILGNPEGQRIWAGARYVGVDQYGEYKGWWADTGKPIAADEWALARAIRHGETSLNEVIDIECFDGTRKTILNSAVPIRADGDEITGAIVVIQDITERRHAEQALIQSENNFRALTENANVGILVNHRGKHVFANNRLLEMLGYTANEFRATGVKELVHPHEYDKVVERFRERLNGQPAPGVYETIFMTKSGQAVPVELTAANTTWQGEPAGLVMLQDIRERLRAETQMRKLSSALEQTADTVMITARTGVIEYVNLGFEKATGYGRDEAVGQKPNMIKSGKQGAEFYKKLWDTILAGEVFSDVFVNRRKDGSLYYEEKTITPLKDAAGVITHFIATGKDVTERMQTQERLQHMAQYDALTELPNRVLFMDRLKQALARARWHERLVAVLFVDIDRFKNINDTLGHEVGDRLLQALAGRLTASVREGDTVARFGGDEFVILLDDVGSDNDIGAVAQKVLETLAPPLTVDSQSLYVTASIGVSLFPNDGENPGALIKNADIAMYRAKELGKNTYQFYSADMSARAFERLTLESSLRHAIERKEFRLYYQPQINTANGTILGVEALLRWQHPDFGLVAPAEFIPLLEETGLIVPVGEWVFHAACEQLCAWHAAGWPALRMAVNLSPRQFQATGLAMMVERGLAAVGCDPGLIEIEITENVLLRHAGATVDVLDALRTLGVRMAIDDFGTGYSSLSYLRRYSIDTLKIDRSFVHDVPGDADDCALASAIIVLTQSLKLDVIAEGVETEAQHAFLQERGCRVMQGYLFSRPLPAEDITRLLEKAPWPQMNTDEHG